MPVANKEFLKALLEHGTFESYHFFCDDRQQVNQFRRLLDQSFPESLQKRIRVAIQGLFFEEFKKYPLDVMHHGDFSAFFPYVMELRNGMVPPGAFPVTGVTHALDTIKLHMSFMQILLARPKPFDAIVCTSKCAVDMLTKAFDHIRETFDSVYQAKLSASPALVQIPLGIPEEMFRPQDRIECRSQLGIAPNHFVMLSLGRFSPRRKADLAPFLECVAWLKEQPLNHHKLPEFTLILAGAGRAPDLKLVQDMVDRLGLQKEVRIEGNVSSETKILLYGAADVYISLVDNYQETFGLSIIEAMAQGLPVIASDFNGYKELVAHQRTGFLIPTYVSSSHEPWEPLSALLNFTMLRFYRAQKIAFDLEQLALAIMTLASHQGLRQEMGFRARTRALPYRWHSVIPRYEELWSEQKARAADWYRLAQSTNHLPPMLIPCTEKYFSHYPTLRLTAEDRIKLSDYGTDRCRQNFQPIVYEELASLLQEDCLKFLTQQLAQETVSIEALLDRCQKAFDASREMLLVHLDWLLKHGFIAIVRS